MCAPVPLTCSAREPISHPRALVSEGLRSHARTRARGRSPDDEEPLRHDSTGRHRRIGTRVSCATGASCPAPPDVPRRARRHGGARYDRSRQRRAGQHRGPTDRHLAGAQARDRRRALRQHRCRRLAGLLRLGHRRRGRGVRLRRQDGLQPQRLRRGGEVRAGDHRGSADRRVHRRGRSAALAAGPRRLRHALRGGYSGGGRLPPEHTCLDRARQRTPSTTPNSTGRRPRPSRSSTPPVSNSSPARSSVSRRPRPTPSRRCARRTSRSRSHSWSSPSCSSGRAGGCRGG